MPIPPKQTIRDIAKIRLDKLRKPPAALGKVAMERSHSANAMRVRQEAERLPEGLTRGVKKGPVLVQKNPPNPDLAPPIKGIKKQPEY